MKWLKWVITLFVGLLVFVVQTAVFETIIRAALEQPVGVWGHAGITIFALILTIGEVIAFLKRSSPSDDS